LVKNRLLLLAKTHSNNSKIAEKINRKRTFWTTNLIKTVAAEIISNNNSFISELLDADPLI
jgi:hypothetical protein